MSRRTKIIRGHFYALEKRLGYLKNIELQLEAKLNLSPKVTISYHRVRAEISALKWVLETLANIYNE